MGNMTAAAGGAGGQQEESSRVNSLVQMGFSREASVEALSFCNNDLNRAMQLLMEQRQVEERNKRASAAAARSHTRSIAGNIHNRLPNPVPQRAPRLDINLDVVGEMEDQAQAIDTLYYVLNTIVDNPTELKYRSIKASNPRFREVFSQDARLLAQANKFLLQECGFEKAGEYYTLAPNCDFDKIIANRDRLARVRQSSSKYAASKQRIEFEKAMLESQQTASREEEERRQRFAALLPAEPELGAAGTTRIKVIVSERGAELQRTFSSHDTLRDVMHFVGSQRSLVGQKLLEGTWVLVDETLLEKRELRNVSDKTLFALKLWPSAVLHIRLHK